MKMKKLFLASLSLAALLSVARAEVITPHVPLGYQQFTVVASSGLTIPTGATLAVITPEAQAVRYRDDGTDPTAAVGQPLAVGATLSYSGNLGKIKFIEQTSGAKVNVSYYR